MAWVGAPDFQVYPFCFWLRVLMWRSALAGRDVNRIAPIDEQRTMFLGFLRPPTPRGPHLDRIFDSHRFEKHRRTRRTRRPASAAQQRPVADLKTTLRGMQSGGWQSSAARATPVSQKTFVPNKCDRAAEDVGANLLCGGDPRVVQGPGLPCVPTRSTARFGSSVRLLL